MKLLTKEIRAKLIANGREQAKVKGTKAEKDFSPVELGIERDRFFEAKAPISRYIEAASAPATSPNR